MGPPPDGGAQGERPASPPRRPPSRIAKRKESEVNELHAERGGDQALFVTADGYEQLRSELERLCTDGSAGMSERLREARADGHLANNPALYDLLEEQVQLERRIAILERQLAAAEIVVPVADGAASIGSVVRVRDRQTGDLAEYELVGPIESDIANGRVSVDAPVGRALVRRSAGAVVDVETPSGRLGLKVLSVRTRGAPPPAREAA
jgi:transcription elongation factor GreA